MAADVFRKHGDGDAEARAWRSRHRGLKASDDRRPQALRAEPIRAAAIM